MATYTADAAHGYVSPRGYYVGLNTIVGKYNAGGVTISSGDVYQMVKIPHGATIVNMNFFGRSPGTGGIVFSLGTSASTTLFGAVTISATHQYISVNSQASATQQLPYTVSLSDDAVPQYITLQLTQASGTATNTGSFGLVVQYVMQGAGGP